MSMDHKIIALVRATENLLAKQASENPEAVKMAKQAAVRLAEAGHITKEQCEKVAHNLVKNQSGTVELVAKLAADNMKKAAQIKKLAAEKEKKSDKGGKADDAASIGSPDTSKTASVQSDGRESDKIWERMFGGV